MKYKPYPKYKDSGVEWLGKIPSHWEVAPTKRILQRNDGGVWGEDFDDDGTIVLRSTEMNVAGEWKIKEPAKRKLSSHEIASGLLKEGDLLITKSSGSALHLGKTALVSKEIEDLKCCFSNFMQRLRTNKNYNPIFLRYILNSCIGREQFNLLGNSTTGLTNLSSGLINEVLITRPPFEEQILIVDFLRLKLSKLDALIEKKQKLIQLLSEKRTALISQAVTKGLDLSVPMKDSGVEWLGEIPSHWEVKRLRYAALINPVKSQLKLKYGYDVSFLPMENISTEGQLLLEEERPIDDVYSSFTYFEDGDIIIAKITPCFENGKGSLAKGLLNGVGFGTTELHVLRANQNIDPHYLYCITKSNQFMKYGEMEMKGAAGQKRVPAEFIENFKIGIPPFEEQKAIAVFLDRETTKLDSIIKKTTESIEKFKEYRSALISAVVTGKIAVFANPCKGDG